MAPDTSSAVYTWSLGPTITNGYVTGGATLSGSINRPYEPDTYYLRQRARDAAALKTFVDWARRWIRCESHSPPPVEIELATLPVLESTPPSRGPARRWMRHRLGCDRQPRPIRSRPGAR